MKKFVVLLLSIIMILSIAACTKQSNSVVKKTEITISAASSLTDILNEAKMEYEKAHPDVKITYNFGSSGKLVQQIQSGAPTDLFVAASKSYMDQLETKDLIDKATRGNIAANEIVLIGNKEKTSTVQTFQDLSKLTNQKVAIGNPDSVPAGKYAEEVMKHFNELDVVKKSFVMGSDVRQVLTYVESGNAELGVVFASDALTSTKVKVLATSDATWHTPIVYPSAVLKGSTHKDVAASFLEFLKGSNGKALFKKYGFK